MNIKKLLKEAQFHGFNKLDDAKCRWIWILSLFLLFLASSAIAASIVLRFLDQPTFIARMETAYSSMEFPSVLLCPETSFPEHKIDEFLSRLKYPPNLNASYVKGIIQQLGAFYCPDVPYTVRELQRIETLLDFNGIDVYLAGKKMTLSCEETLMRCRLFGVMRNCTELFTLEISQYGFCCVFNGLSLRSEIKMYGIRNVVPKSIYHTSSVGFHSGLMLAVNQSGPLDNVDLTYKWVSIDGGHAYIDWTLNGTPVAPSTEMWLAHRLDGIQIDEDAARLDSTLRGCRLTSEPLTLFPIHHKKYCQLECEIYYLLQACGCGMWTHPLPPEAPICRARLLPCARQALARFNKDACPCIHTCDVDMDSAEITSFKLIPHSACLDPFYNDLDYSKTSIVRVFNGQRMVKTKSRRAYYTYFDLFSQLGGIFNVFFGCSLLSILEIIQLVKHAWRDRRKPSEYLNHKKQEMRKVILRNKRTKVKKRDKRQKKVRFCN